MPIKKQMKITKLFRNGATKRPEDCEELQDEVNRLEQHLREKQNEFFQILRSNCKKKAPSRKTKDVPFVHPELLCMPPYGSPPLMNKIVLASSVEKLKRELELMCMLTGVEVQSYEKGDHVCVLYHMQHSSPHAVQHGLRIDMRNGCFEVSRSSMPLGFNLKAVVSEFDKVIEPPCLLAVRRALVAYYNRLQQYDALKELLHLDAELFKTLDGAHVQISFEAQSRDDDDDQLPVTLMLDYKIYDVTPKTYSFKEDELPEGVAEVLNAQCVTFKDKPLRRAFKQAFMDDLGPYRLVHQIGPRQEERRARPAKRPRPNNHNYNMDDTYQPEDCSDPSDDEH